jgi:phospholipase D1/2
MKMEIREVEALFLDTIDRAERTIYIENQFLTATSLARRLARRMRERPELEVVLVVPRAHHSWLEALIMRTGRIRFLQILQQAGVAERVAMLCPQVAEGRGSVDVMVHSKVMVVDDSLLRVGSANLNNRSIGLDTECDLAIEATTPEQRYRLVRPPVCAENSESAYAPRIRRRCASPNTLVKDAPIHRAIEHLGP